MNITSSNSVFTLSVPDVFDLPNTLQGFATDAAFETEAVTVGEAVLGVDGKLSAAYIPFLTPLTITLQADSPSLGIFDAWLAQEIANQTKYFASAVIALPSIKKVYNCYTGMLETIQQFPGAKRMLQPNTFKLLFESVVPAPSL